MVRLRGLDATYECHMPFYLGIDGGGTQTRAVLVNERGEVLGRGVAGPSNYHSVGLDGAFDNILIAERAARAQAGLAPDQALDAVCLGLAGCGTEEDRAKLLPVAKSRLNVAPQWIRIESDLRAAHAGAFEGGPGIVLIAGTGSACFGADAKGRVERAGGWGPMFDDFGSGFDMGRRAITHALFVADGRTPPTQLASEVTQALGGNLRAIAQLTAKGEDRNRIAGLAPLVFAAAERGESFAMAIVHAGIEELGRMVGAVVSRLDFSGSEIEVVVLGGLNNAGRAFFQRLYDAIRRQVPRASIVSDMLPAVMGAALLALRLRGVKITNEMLSAMRQ